jgi:23S rRNA pseudouridine2605 synthase
MTSGLLLLTNDGGAANRLTHPRYRVEKGYRVTVRGQPKSRIDRELRRPIELDQRPVEVVRVTSRQLDIQRTEIDLVLLEGRHRIVRRICELLGVQVEHLVRTSHGPVQLGRLPVGRWRYLTEDELTAVLAVALPEG